MTTIQIAAMALGAVESLRPTLVPRTTKHQVLVTGSCVATMGLLGLPGRRTPIPGSGWLAAAGAGLALLRAAKHVKAQRGAYPGWDPRPQNAAAAIVAGSLAGVALAHAPVAAGSVLGTAGRTLAGDRGGSSRLWATAVAAGALVGLSAAGTTGATAALRRLREIGNTADAALVEPPDNSFVSGGPASGIAYDTLARDGRRFVSLRTPAEQIRTVDGQAMEPIRVYAGLHSADTLEQRVELALDDLERLGGFDRSTLLIMSPAGSGYADYVAAEAIECFTGGDCASVVVQYGVLPSMLSLGRVELGARTVRLLLDRIRQRVAARASAPRILMYGESLGARVAQEALQRSPALVDEEGRVAGIEALVSVGTPGGPSLRNELLHSPNVVHLDRWQQMTGDESAQLWFIDHDADPVTRWDGALAWRFPYWLKAPRGRNVPADMAWLPVLTWWQVIFDLVFAAQQQSGLFRSVGHDYRADLAPVLSKVVGEGADVDKVAHLLAQREVERDALTSSPIAGTLPPH
ncbi:MAG: alpha/beta hydrolase [Candidatus Nanopelagicales bacterium]|nr:alpha/beta hydrolase [Candidatus Nanopelagicales bacterium]